MKDGLALKPLGFILLSLALALALTTILLSGPAGQFLVPTPEMSAEQFLVAMNAHRYFGAWNQLSSQSQQEWTMEELRSVQEQLEASHPTVSSVKGESSSIQGDQATATVSMEYQGDPTQDINLPLVRENHVWVVDLSEVSLLDFIP